MTAESAFVGREVPLQISDRTDYQNRRTSRGRPLPGAEQKGRREEWRL